MLSKLGFVIDVSLSSIKQLTQAFVAVLKERAEFFTNGTTTADSSLMHPKASEKVQALDFPFLMSSVFIITLNLTFPCVSSIMVSITMGWRLGLASSSESSTVIHYFLFTSLISYNGHDSQRRSSSSFSSR
jgi:hypothetical protein